MQTAANLQAQVEFLHAKLAQKNQQVEQYQQLIEQKNRSLLQLEEWIKQQRQHRFGASSEKRSADQLGLFNEAEVIDQEAATEATETITVTSHTRQRNPRVSIPANLPREEIVHD